MSLVAEIVCVNDEKDLKDIRQTLDKLTPQIDLFANDVKTMMHRKHVAFDPRYFEGKDFLTTLRYLNGQIVFLSEKFEMQASSGVSSPEFDNLHEIFKQMQVTFEAPKLLVETEWNLEQAGEELVHHNYMQVAQHLLDSSKHLKSACLKNEREVVNSLKDTLYSVHAEFLLELNEAWKRTVVCKKNTRSQNGYVIDAVLDNQEKIPELLRAMQEIKELKCKLQTFAKKLNENVLMAIILKKCNISINCTENCITLETQVPGDERADDPVRVLKNLVKVFQFLELVFDMETPRNPCMPILGETLAKDLCQMIHNHIVVEAMPRNGDDRIEFIRIIHSVVKLYKYFLDIGFVTSIESTIDCSILKFINDIDLLMVEKICQKKMEEARQQIKTDLHQLIAQQNMAPHDISIDMSLSNQMDNESLDISREDSIAAVNVSDSTLSSQNMRVVSASNHLQFEQCQTSRTAAFIVETVQEIVLKERPATAANNIVSKHLYSAAGWLIEMYITLAPVCHSDFLKTLPLPGVVFYNDCMYIAYHLLVFDAKQVESNSMEATEPVAMFLYKDLAHSVRTVGEKVLSQVKNIHSNKIIDILKGSGLTHLEDCSYEAAVKPIEEALNYLDFLQKCWKHVLQCTPYNKLMGSLLNTLIEEILKQICQSKKIPSDTAEHLVSLFNTVLTKHTTLLHMSLVPDIYVLVRRHPRLEDLVYLLQRNTSEILKRWNNGNGDMVRYFQIKGVKDFVAAIFDEPRQSKMLSLLRFD